MRKSIMVAMTPNGVIGHQSKMPWHLPEDLRRFKQITTGHPIIMGRRTFESMGKPLPNRHNIVISRDPDYEPEGADAVQTMIEGMVLAESTGAEEVFVIGGREAYKQAIQICDRVYLTLIEKEFHNDITFAFDFSAWQIISREYVDGVVPYQFIILDKRTNKMTQWLTIERLPNNELPSPRYETPLSAGLDFAACLARPCKKIDGDTKTEFIVIENLRIPIVPEAPPLPSPKTRLLSIAPNEVILIPLGFKCSFHPIVCMKLYVRSSAGLRGLGLANGTGIIDPDYRGELFAAIRNHSQKTIDIKHGERIVQAILTPFYQAIVKEGPVDTTARGIGGFGSTGTMVNMEMATGLQLESGIAPTDNASQTEPQTAKKPN